MGRAEVFCLSQHERHAQFFAKRLSGMGVEVKCANGEQTATGVIYSFVRPF